MALNDENTAKLVASTFGRQDASAARREALLRHDLIDLDHGHPVVSRGVQDLASLAAGAADQRRANPLGVVLRHGGGTLRRLIVRMRMDGHNRQLGHRASPFSAPVE